MFEKLTTLAGKIVFRLAFAGLIFVQFVVVVLLLWGLSAIISGDNYFAEGILAILLLASPFLIGANSYLIFQRFTRVQYTLAESERWLSERHKLDARQIRRRNRARRWVIWIPALSVLLFCLFLDETWPPVSHLFHPAAGRLIGYNVPIPLTWAIIFSEPGSDSHSYSSYVSAFRSRRLFRGSVDFFLGGRPSVLLSSFSFNGGPPGDQVSSPWRPDGQLPIRTRSFPVGDALLNCEEFAPKADEQKDQADIRCTTPRGELAALFAGDRNDSSTFYRVVQRIKKTK